MIQKWAAKLALLLVVFLSAIDPATAAFQGNNVFDNAQLFTQEQRAALSEAFQQQGAEGNIDIVVVTAPNLNGKTPKRYLEEFYDANAADENGIYPSAALLLLNMTPDARSVEIQGYGTAEIYLNNERIEAVLDEITPQLADGNFYDAMLQYAEQAAYYMQQDIEDLPSGNNNSWNPQTPDVPAQKDSFLFNTLFHLLIALAIGGVTVGIMAAWSGGRVTTSNHTYLDSGHSRVVAQSDHFIRTAVTRVKRPDDNNNNGGIGGGGGISPGGHSHSGGGRSF